MREYVKIETIYNRATDGTKKLIEGEYRNKTVESLKNIRWLWTEKIDGTNIRVNWDGHRITFGGRTDRAQIHADLINFLNKTFQTPEAEELFEQHFGENQVTLYGEGYGRRIQKSGGLYRPDDVSFILFDVMIGDTIWLTRNSVEDIARAFGIGVVPVVGIGTLDEAVEFVKNNPMSTIGSAPMEGIVCRPELELYDRLRNRIIVKIKARDFK